MPDPAPSPYAEATNPEVRRERTDANAMGLVVFGICFVAFAALLHVSLYGFFWRLDTDRIQGMHRPPPIAATRLKLPEDIDKIPAPRLQISDRKDMQQLLARDQRILAGGRWTDAQGKVHTPIPIETALKTLSDPTVAARHGLKLREPKREKP